MIVKTTWKTFGIRVFVRANNTYYVFLSKHGIDVDEPIILWDYNAHIPLGNWFPYIREFSGDDYFNFLQFVEAIDKYFKNK